MLSFLLPMLFLEQWCSLESRVSRGFSLATRQWWIWNIVPFQMSLKNGSSMLELWPENVFSHLDIVRSPSKLNSVGSSWSQDSSPGMWQAHKGLVLTRGHLATRKIMITNDFIQLLFKSCFGDILLEKFTQWLHFDKGNLCKDHRLAHLWYVIKSRMNSAE